MHHLERGEKVEKTKNKNKLIKRVSAFLCAFMILFSDFGASCYSASVLSTTDISAYVEVVHEGLSKQYLFTDSYVLPSVVNDYEYYMLMTRNDGYMTLLLSNTPICMTDYDGKLGVDDSYVSLDIYPMTSEGDMPIMYSSSNGVNWSITNPQTRFGSYVDYVDDVNNTDSYSPYFLGNKFVTSNHDITLLGTPFVVFDSNGPVPLGPRFDSTLGYLQNVRMHTVFDDVPLGETTGEKWTSRWYYDKYSTTGIDLTSGDYMINYYQERWIVKGYGKDDVVEKSDRYLLGTYIVQNGYIETYSEDIESTLAGQGYEEPSMLDLLWNKFITTHYYFQIVDAKNNQVGGFLHIYLTDDNGKFGVEHIGETLDDKGEYDDGGYKDFIEDDSITTDDIEQGFDELEQDNEQTLEEWFESFGGVGVDKLEGSDAFSTVFESYASQVSEVSNAVGAIFGVLPPWILGSIGISFVLLIILMILKES